MFQESKLLFNFKCIFFGVSVSIAYQKFFAEMNFIELPAINHIV